ncbi:MAG: hypothetical protein ICV63_16870 [Coleofasciculus sp. Co-bin14]|nr:hypothetical protein [Coleofasciculus sp. Co-bin14]
MLKTIVGHFLGDRDAYMTTELPGINGCNPDIVRVADYGSSPLGGNFRLKPSTLYLIRMQTAIFSLVTSHPKDFQRTL